jgi:hypothetical protein
MVAGACRRSNLFTNLYIWYPQYWLSVPARKKPFLCKMEPHYHLDDAAFETAFANASLDPSLFSHEAHLRLAWIHIHQYGIEQAIENICSQLMAFTKAVGAADKYNHTLTIAAVRAVYHFTRHTSLSVYYIYYYCLFSRSVILWFRRSFSFFNSIT